MIRLYDVVEAAGSHLKEGTLVLHRSMRVHPTFKVYKKFCYDLYKVINSNKELLFSYENTENTPSDSIEEIWDKSDKLYLEILIKWLTSEEYKTMLNNVII